MSICRAWQIVVGTLVLEILASENPAFRLPRRHAVCVDSELIKGMGRGQPSDNSFADSVEHRRLIQLSSYVQRSHLVSVEACKQV